MIRTIVYGMRPPALDELGLTDAILQVTNGLRDRDGRQDVIAVIEGRYIDRDVVLGGNGGGGSGYAHN